MRRSYSQFVSALVLMMALSGVAAVGDSFEWVGHSGNWNAGDNWHKTTNVGENSYPQAGDIALFTSGAGYTTKIGDPRQGDTSASNVGQIVYAAGAPTYSIIFAEQATVAPPPGQNAFINNSTNNQDLTFLNYPADHSLFSSGGFSGKGEVHFSDGYPTLSPGVSGVVSWDADTSMDMDPHVGGYWTIQNPNSDPLTVNVTGNILGQSGIHLYGTSDGTNNLLVANFSGTNTLGGGIQLGTGGGQSSTLMGDTNSIKDFYFESPSTVIFRETGHFSPSADVYNSVITSYDTDSSGASIVYSPQYSGSSLEIQSSIPASDRSESTGPTINIEVTKGTLILSGTNSYGGSSTINSGAALAFKAALSYPGGGRLIVASGGTLDLSRGDISRGNFDFYTFSTNTLNFSPGSNVLMNVNSMGFSAQMSLEGTGDFDLSPINLIIKPEGDATEYQDGQTYTVFTARDSRTIINPPSSVQTTPSTFPFAAIMVDSLTIKLVRKPNQNTGLGAQNSVVSANNGFLKHRIVRGVLSEIRGYAAGERGERRNPFASFRHPLHAVNPEGGFLNMTEGSAAKIVEDNMQQWAPLRNGTTGVWVQPFGMTLRQGSSGGSVGYNTRTGGIVFGIDHKVRYDLIVGGGVGYARTNLNFDADSGETRISDKFLTIFGTWFRDKWYMDADFIAGVQRYRGYRTVYPGVWAANHHGGYQLTPHLGGGYKLPTGHYTTHFFAGIDYAYSFERGYQETGAPLNNLCQQGRSASMIRSEGGMSVSRTYEKESVAWTPAFKLSVVNKNPIQKGRIISADGNSVMPTTKAQTLLSPGVDARVKFLDGWSFGICYNGEFAVRSSSNEILFEARKSF